MSTSKLAVAEDPGTVAGADAGGADRPDGAGTDSDAGSDADADAAAAAAAAAEICQNLHLQQLRAYTCDDNQYANISSRHAEQYLLRTGSHVLVDAMHPALRELALLPGGLRFSHTCAPDGTAIGSAPLVKKGTSLETFIEHEESEDMHPVLHAMLLYELPESIAPRSHDLAEYEVWVGFRQFDGASKHVTAHYMAVPSRALIPPSRLEGLGYMQAVFDLFRCKSVAPVPTA